MDRVTIMMQIIHAACAHDQHTFDGWVIGKAFYGRYDDSEPVSFETRTQRMRQGYARLSSKGYDKERNLVQDLVLVLVDPSCVNGVTRRDTYTDVFPGRPMHGLTFPSEGLKRFLRDSGDTNPIHHGKQAVVPGLWILERLQGIWQCEAAQAADTDPDDHGLPLGFHIRFFHPVRTGQTVQLVCTEDAITGVCGGLIYFHLQVNKL